MSRGGDRDDRDDRPRRSWRDIDRMRDGGRRERDPVPRDAASQARAQAAAQRYKKQLDGLFQRGGSEAARLADAVRAAHGTPGLADACRAYLAQSGPPRDAALASLLLDAGDREIVLRALEGLAAAREAGELRVGPGLRSQLQLLAEDRDDDVALAAETLLADRGALGDG